MNESNESPESYFDDKNKKSFLQTFLQNTDPDRKITNEFLKCVAWGDLEGAEKLLIKNKFLVHMRGEFIDSAGRKFESTTGFQYAVWSLDSKMWMMIIDKGRMSYNHCAFHLDKFDNSQHGTNFNFTPLINAYSSFIKQKPLLVTEEKWKQYLLEIGKRQQELPAWCVLTCNQKGEGSAWIKQNFTIEVTRENLTAILNRWHKEGCGEIFAWCRGTGSSICTNNEGVTGTSGMYESLGHQKLIVYIADKEGFGKLSEFKLEQLNFLIKQSENKKIEFSFN